jgi:tetratricopeptide (TPR) repeat protein
MNLRTVALTLGVVVLLAVPALGDMLLLEDGRVIEGRTLERVDDGVKVKFENGEVFVPNRLIRDAILENDPLLQPKTDEEKAELEKGNVRFEGKWVSRTRRDQIIQKRIAARKEEIEGIRLHAEWRNRYKGKSKHFTFEYTVPPHIYEYYRGMMEAYFVAFSKTWKVKPLKEQPRLPIMFYTDRAKFHQTSGAPGGALAYFRFVKPREINFYYDRLDPVSTEKVMYHEVNHYLQLLLDEKFNMPHFPSEALAEYYGGSKYDPKTGKLAIGLVQEHRLVQIQGDIARGELLGLEKMINSEGMGQHYSWGWSLVHYCMNSSKLKSKFEKYVKTLVHGRGVKRDDRGAGMVTVHGPENWRIFKKVMGLKKSADVQKLQTQWHNYVKVTLKVTSSGGLEAAAHDAARSGRKIRAKRLYKEAIDEGSASAFAYHSFARILDRDGKKDEEAIEYWRKSVELDPLEPTYYVALGRALIKANKTREGKQLIALAKELDPDNPYLNTEVLFGD